MLALDHPTDKPTYWQKWRADFDYVYVLFTDDDTVNPAPEVLKLIYDGGRFHLYRINKPT